MHDPNLPKMLPVAKIESSAACSAEPSDQVTAYWCDARSDSRGLKSVERFLVGRGHRLHRIRSEAIGIIIIMGASASCNLLFPSARMLSSLLLLFAIASLALANSQACKSHQAPSSKIPAVLVRAAHTDSGSSTATIASQSDADALADCDTLDGSITISSSASGVITIPGVQEVKGSFTAEGASGLTTIAAPSLENVKGSLTLDNLGSLTNVSMPALSQVSSGITVTGNSKLTMLEFEELEEVDGPLQLTGSFTR